MEKKGAMELSIGTIVVIVLAMAMLILGLVLVRTIFKGATESVNDLSDKVKGEITNLFVDESSKIVVKLGADKTARIKAGTENFGVGIGAKTSDGSAATGELQYKLSLDESARENCLSILKAKKTEELFTQKLGSFSQFDQFQGDTAFAIIQMSIPEGTTLCTQKVYVDVKDGEDTIGREVFIIEVIRKGIF
jgi:hypothetical protein